MEKTKQSTMVHCVFIVSSQSISILRYLYHDKIAMTSFTEVVEMGNQRPYGYVSKDSVKNKKQCVYVCGG